MIAFDFKLSDEDTVKIKTLDLGHSEIVDHDDPNFIRMLHYFKIHDQ